MVVGKTCHCTAAHHFVTGHFHAPKMYVPLCEGLRDQSGSVPGHFKPVGPTLQPATSNRRPSATGEVQGLRRGCNFPAAPDSITSLIIIQGATPLRDPPPGCRKSKSPAGQKDRM